MEKSLKKTYVVKYRKIRQKLGVVNGLIFLARRSLRCFARCCWVVFLQLPKFYLQMTWMNENLHGPYISRASNVCFMCCDDPWSPRRSNGGRRRERRAWGMSAERHGGGGHIKARASSQSSDVSTSPDEIPPSPTGAPEIPPAAAPREEEWPCVVICLTTCSESAEKWGFGGNAEQTDGGISMKC